MRDDMKDLKKKLRSDARRIEVAVPPGLAERMENRIGASWHSASGAGDSLRSSPTLLRPALGGGFALSIALLVAVLARPLFEENREAIPAVASVATANDGEARLARLSRAMENQSAPEAQLEEELQRLNADWRRIRNGVRRQVDPLL